MITIKEVDKLAELARIKIINKEKQKFQKEIGAVLDYVAQLQKAPTAKTKFPLENPTSKSFREDENPHKSNEFSKELLAEAPNTKNGYVKTQHIFAN